MLVDVAYRANRKSRVVWRRVFFFFCPLFWKPEHGWRRTLGGRQREPQEQPRVATRRRPSSDSDPKIYARLEWRDGSPDKLKSGKEGGVSGMWRARMKRRRKVRGRNVEDWSVGKEGGRLEGGVGSNVCPGDRSGVSY